MEFGPSLDRRSEGLGHPLIVAAKRGSRAILGLLFKHGAKVDGWDLQDPDTLTAAVNLGHEELVQAGLDNRVNVKIKDSHDPRDVAWTDGYGGIYDLLSIGIPRTARQNQGYGLRPGYWIPVERSRKEPNHWDLVFGYCPFSEKSEVMWLTKLQQQ